MKRLTTLAAMITAGACAAELPTVQQMLAKKTQFFTAAVHPETHMIYARVDLEDPDHWRKAVFPSPDAIREKTNADAEVPNVSNCAFAGGLFLGQLADIYQDTRDPATVEQARIVFDGLVRLARASEKKGFVARCLLPGDATKAHFLNSSVDQYTFFVYGFYKYFHSGMAGEAEKQVMSTIMAEICALIEREGTIPATNGAPGWVSDIEAIRADRSSRMLEVFLVGHDITGDRRWRTVYLEKVREAAYGRLRSILNPIEIRYTYAPRDYRRGIDYADVNSMWQTQYSLVPLFELETDLPLKAAYLEALRTNARIAERYGKQGAELQIVMLAENRELFGDGAAGAGKRSAELTERCAALLDATPFSRTAMPRTSALASSITHVGIDFPAAAGVFWTGRRNKVFQSMTR